MSLRNGSCHCGHVKCETELAPMLVWSCNCNSCRRYTGFMGVRAAYGSDEIKFTGATSEYVYQGGSGGNIYTESCPNCHTACYATFDFMEGVTVVPIGVFDDPHSLTPKLEVFTEHKLNWVSDKDVIQHRFPDQGLKERLVALLESLENR